MGWSRYKGLTTCTDHRNLGMNNFEVTTTTCFSFGEDKIVRVAMINDEPWFCAKDVCDVLGLSNSRQMVQNIKADYRADVCLIYTSQVRHLT